MFKCHDVTSLRHRAPAAQGKHLFPKAKLPTVNATTSSTTWCTGAHHVIHHIVFRCSPCITKFILLSSSGAMSASAAAAASISFWSSAVSTRTRHPPPLFPAAARAAVPPLPPRVSMTTQDVRADTRRARRVWHGTLSRDIGRLGCGVDGRCPDMSASSAQLQFVTSRFRAPLL